MVWNFIRTFAIAAVIAMFANQPATAYVIDISKDGLVDPSKAITDLEQFLL